MNKLYSLRYISAVHAMKCNKSAAEEDAKASFNQLLKLKNDVDNATEQKFPDINQVAIAWAAENPIATEREIDQLLNQN